LATKEQHLLAHAISLAGTDLRAVLLPSFEGRWYALIVTLFLATFVHEFIAIGIAAYSVADHRLSLGLATLVLFAGIVAGDWCIYGLGAAARHLPGIRRWTGSRRVLGLQDWSARNLLTVVVTARMLPAGLFPTFTALGWTGVSFVRFARISALVAAIYVPVVLYMLIKADEVAITRFGNWAWLVVAPVAAAGFVRWPRLRTKDSPPTPTEQTHQGMPALPQLSTPASLAERIPPLLFYTPIVIQWFYLGFRHGSLTLPTVSNPLIETGGLFGESKSQCLDFVGGEERKWLAPYVSIKTTAGGACEVGAALEKLRTMGVDFPLVVKPDVGWRGFGVRLVHDERALRRDIAANPLDQTLILQKYIGDEGEAGIFYIRFPEEKQGRIFSLCFRYFPHVVGDGRSSVAELVRRSPRTRWKESTHFGRDSQHRGIAARELHRIPRVGEVVRLSFIGSNRVGGLYCDGRRYITKQLERRIDQISHGIPEFYFARFDVRFASVDALMAGEGFSIVEINGAGSEAIHIWDPECSVLDAYKTLFEQQSLLFEIGRQNRARGYVPMPLFTMLGFARKQRRLINTYPPSS